MGLYCPVPDFSIKTKQKTNKKQKSFCCCLLSHVLTIPACTEEREREREREKRAGEERKKKEEGNMFPAV